MFCQRFSEEASVVPLVPGSEDKATNLIATTGPLISRMIGDPIPLRLLILIPTMALLLNQQRQGRRLKSKLRLTWMQR